MKLQGILKEGGGYKMTVVKELNKSCCYKIRDYKRANLIYVCDLCLLHNTTQKMGIRGKRACGNIFSSHQSVADKIYFAVFEKSTF